ncbi:MAG: hypothetical protein ACRDQ7_12295 [Haloechinothrix sp.]
MTTQYEQAADQDTVAGLAREIRLLVDMVIEHSAPWLEGIMAAGHGGDGAEYPAGSDQPDAAAPDNGCGWCPLCAVVAVVRGERPEFSARVLEHAAQLVALLRAVLADRWHPEGGVHMPGFRPAETRPPWSAPSAVEQTMPLPTVRTGPGRVQRIEVRKVGARAASGAGE